MSTQVDSDGHHSRTEPAKLLKPTTLPHGIIPDTGASGERIESYDATRKIQFQNSTTPSDSELLRTFSQSGSQTQIIQGNTGGYSAILLIALRLTFYLAVIAVGVILTLAACKFTNVWDPCTTLFINTTECKVTSYFKGMVYHKDCTEEHKCILPGFQSNVNRQEWSLHKPNDTAEMIPASHNATSEKIDSTVVN